MPKMREDLRKQLENSGRWSDFVRFRDKLKAEGVSSADAHRQAVAEFFDNPPVKITGRRSYLPKEPILPAVLPSPLPNSPDDNHAVESLPRLAPSVKTSLVCTSDALPELSEVSMQDFGGRQDGDIAKIVTWVARNMEVIDPDIAGCPDPMAWGLLAHCRRSATAAAEFWKFTFTKLIPARSQLDSGADAFVEDVGKAGVVIDELIVLRAKSQAPGE